MRFLADGPLIPDILLDRCDDGRVVFLCGAGVSLPSGMPTFVGLTQHVVDFFSPTTDSQIMKAFQPWLDDPSAANVPLDQIFNLLHQEYGKDEVNALVTDRLLAPVEGDSIGYHHNLIKRISSNQVGLPQIVTTNFDLLFEMPGSARDIKVHVPPTFPDLKLGSSIEGITYLHGRLATAGSESHPYVLSSADFGRAYLSEAWATQFIRLLLDHYTVVLVGYQAEDPPVKYLLQGLNHDGRFDRSRLFAFDKGLPEQIEVKWRDRGVTPIAYADHPQLWETLEAWADRADDPRLWRAKVIASAARDPKELTPHQRGQVVNVLRSVSGAKHFADAEPSPHPDWICVLDGARRSANKSSGYGEDAETFCPQDAYGLDDDFADISDEDQRRGVRNVNLLEWIYGDDNPSEFHRLGARQVEGHEAMPIRLWHLVRWIGKSIDSPVVAWWGARQRGMHPRLIDHIAWHLDKSEKLDDKARHVWNLILESHRDPRSHQWDGGWFDLKRRIKNEGWTPSVMRDFHRASQPRLEIIAPLGLPSAKPPSFNWGDVKLDDIARFEVKFLDRHKDDLDVPDDKLLSVITILEDQMSAASGMLSDIGVTYFTTPTFYPGRHVNGKSRHTKVAQVQRLFINLWNRLVDLRPDLAGAQAARWDESDRYFFRKLKLYALSKSEVFSASQMLRTINRFDQDAFWNGDVVRELLFMIVDRWHEISDVGREQLMDRILKGPNQRSYWSDEVYPKRRDEFIGRYGRYLELQGCDLPFKSAKSLENIISGIPDWTDAWAESTVTEQGSFGGWVETDETPDAILDTPINEVISRAQAEHIRDFTSLTEKRPFTGLVKANPRKALAALTSVARVGEFPEIFWTTLISDLPKDLPPRLYRIFLNRLLRLPRPVVVELRHALGRWLEQNFTDVLAFDVELGWLVYDHVVDGILSGGEGAAESGMGEVRQGGQVIAQSRRTFDHAINGPIGMCAEALLDAIPGKKQAEGSLVPDFVRSRLERLFASNGEGSDHAVAICLNKLNWIMYIDPDWTQKRLIPLLAFEHPASEPAWNGFLHSGRVPTPHLAIEIKPLLLNLYPWVENFHWSRHLVEHSAQWLGYMTIFHADEPDGVTRSEMRTVLREMSDTTRNYLIFWLGQVGAGNKDGWKQLVIPFIDGAWPRETVFRTTNSVSSWIAMLDDTNDDFPDVYAVVKKFLIPIQGDSNPFYRFTREVGDEEPITSKHPEATLDFINTVTPENLSRAPYELTNILALIAETKPALTADPRYLRLIDLLENN